VTIITVYKDAMHTGTEICNFVTLNILTQWNIDYRIFDQEKRTDISSTSSNR